MVNVDNRQVLLGAILLFAGATIILGITVRGIPNVPYAVGVAATLAIAAGTLLLGTSEGGRPV
jgi:hypothetical protein